MDIDQMGLLDVGMIWKAVRSGVWYPCGWEDVETANVLDDVHDIAKVQATMTFVVERLRKSGEILVPQFSSDVALAHFAGRSALTHVAQCSIPELRCILAALQSLSSPWRKLPDEVLVEVFSWCIPSYSVLRTSNAPLLFTEICSRWHTLSVNTPSLWTSLTLTENFLINGEAQLRAAADFEKRWRSRHALGLGSNGPDFMSMTLRRSHPLPISISSHSGILLHPDTRQLFYDNFFRLKNLALLIPEPNAWHSAPIPTAEQPLIAPFLETLDIYALQVRSPPAHRRVNWASAYLELIHTSASTLKRINLAFHCLPAWPKIDFNQKWDKLTHITWKPGIPESQVITLFHSAPNLSYVSLPEIVPRYYEETPGPVFQGDPVVMRSLETLVLCARNLTTVFNAIIAPNLQHLVNLAPSNQDKRAMIAFLQRSACPLETLYLYHALYRDHGDLLDVFESVEAGADTGLTGKPGGKRRGHLKALLVTDGHHDHRLLSDNVMDRLTWRPDEGRGAADPTESVGASQEITNNTHPQEPHHSRTVKEVLFPGLEYLSFYDIGSTSPGKLAGMLRSRTVQGVFPDEPRDANSEIPQTSNPVTKLKVLETWHWFASLNDVSDVEWKQIEGLREHGLVFRLFKSSDSGSYMSDAEKKLLRRYVLEEGLVVRDYLHDIGQFAPICLDQETQLSSVV